MAVMGSFQLVGWLVFQTNLSTDPLPSALIARSYF